MTSLLASLLPLLTLALLALLTLALLALLPLALLALLPLLALLVALLTLLTLLVALLTLSLLTPLTEPARERLDAPREVPHRVECSRTAVRLVRANRIRRPLQLIL